MPSPAERLVSTWDRFSRLPGGRRVFDRVLGWLVPYSGSIRPRVLELEPGLARVALTERRRLRNHLRSVHALALGNLGELASGLAMTAALPPEVRGIPIRIEIDYNRKARGTIVAEGRADPPAAVTEDTEATATAVLRDEEGDVVADMVVTWRLRPPEPAATSRP
jgi:acyl-coenzyme A thioesterase PaaI-like protein